MAEAKPKILGQLLIEAGAISEPALQKALSRQLGSGCRLGTLLVEEKLAEEETVARCLSVQLGLPYEPPPLKPKDGVQKRVQGELARRGLVLPLSIASRTLRLAMADPLDLGIVDDVQFQSGRRVEPVVSSKTAVLQGIEETYGGGIQGLLGELPTSDQPDRADTSKKLERAASAAPVVRLVEHLLQEAAKEGASDIHIEEQGGEILVRFRLDGILRSFMTFPAESRDPVVSRLKIMAGMDISVKRKPQDGGMKFLHGERQLNLRVSSLPLTVGEKIVIRVLDPTQAPRSLGGLGLADEDLSRFRHLLSGNQGVILAAGPTGSGKSSTLFGALVELDRTGLNLVTLEDPVEYSLPGANQVQVNPKAGLTFPAALRSVLRQDPDIIMVGEIRDKETAEIAMAAAVTGHLVLSTIHTVDAPGAITRLLNMGVAPYLLAGGLAGVVAQRLVRRLCKNCRGRSGEGCPSCPDGYRGRTGVFQILTMTDALREAVAREEPLANLRRLAVEGGMGSLKEDAMRKVAEGTTSPHEIGQILNGEAGAHLPCPHCQKEVPSGSLACPWCGSLRTQLCLCGGELNRAWKYCPNCLRRA